jgi:hypothetical protein
MKLVLSFTNLKQRFTLPSPVYIDRIRFLQIAVYNDGLALDGEPLFFSETLFDNGIELDSNKRYTFCTTPNVSGSWFLSTRDLDRWDCILNQKVYVSDFNFQIFYNGTYGDLDLSLTNHKIVVEIEIE